MCCNQVVAGILFLFMFVGSLLAGLLFRFCVLLCQQQHGIRRESRCAKLIKQLEETRLRVYAVGAMLVSVAVAAAVAATPDGMLAAQEITQ